MIGTGQLTPEVFWQMMPADVRPPDEYKDEYVTIQTDASTTEELAGYSEEDLAELDAYLKG